MAPPLRETIAEINVAFQRGARADQVLQQLRSLPWPIFIDFNNVLVNNYSPLVANPAAYQFLSDLQAIEGQIVVLTSALDWTSVRSVLSEHRLWNDDMVLMTATAYGFLTSDAKTDDRVAPYTEADMRRGVRPWEAGQQLIDAYITWAHIHRGLVLTREDFDESRSLKRIAPIFQKRWDLPLIDDFYEATHDNPGILGYWVEEWEPDMEPYSGPDIGLRSFDQVVALVAEHRHLHPPARPVEQRGSPRHR